MSFELIGMGGRLDLWDDDAPAIVWRIGTLSFCEEEAEAEAEGETDAEAEGDAEDTLR